MNDLCPAKSFDEFTVTYELVIPCFVQEEAGVVLVLVTQSGVSMEHGAGDRCMPRERDRQETHLRLCFAVIYRRTPMEARVIS